MCPSRPGSDPGVVVGRHQLHISCRLGGYHLAVQCDLKILKHAVLLADPGLAFTSAFLHSHLLLGTEALIKEAIWKAGHPRTCSLALGS